MLAYRIANQCFISDLSGAGAEKYPGRWNLEKIPMIYTSGSLSLAMLEKLVHVTTAAALKNQYRAIIEIEEGAGLKQITPAELPLHWKDYPAPIELATIGTAWNLGRESLLLKVPSVVNPEEYNVLINPLHPHISKVKILDVAPWSFDGRFLGG